MTDSKQSKGGTARANKLSPEKRKEQARRGAAARWSASAAIPRAEFGSSEAPLCIGEFKFDCFVLNNAQRVITQRGMFRGLGVVRGGGGGREDIDATDGGGELPPFASQKWLFPHLSNDLKMALRNPILFDAPGLSRAYGYPATILPDICDAILTAKQAGDTTDRQDALVKRAQALISALARVGIIALVDEATGYQAYRARDELQKILAAYISPELLPWAKRFPDVFYEQIHRVWGWPYKPGNNSRNAYIGQLTNSLIYEQLPPGVLEELRNKSPKNPSTGRRKTTLHQGLTEEMGHPSLEKQISATTTLLRATPSGKPGFFKELFKHAFPERQGELDLDIPDDAHK
jgi:hypothetical protein